MRTVRSQWWRRNLEIEAAGRCYLCGGELGEDWQPDHVKPWSRGGETVPSNIRAACRPCNQRKGAMQFRGFQQWLHDRFGDVARLGIPVPEEIILDAGCGGGKSVAVLVVAYWLIERLKVVDRIIWIVPNGSLRRQAAQACGPTEVAARLLGHRLEIIEASNIGNPAKGKAGYAVTYAAIAAARRVYGDSLSNPHVEELSKLRYVAIWDEPHHMTVGGNDDEAMGYARGAEPIRRLAKINVFMSGTLYRHDRKPIAFLPYHDGLVDQRETDARWFHRYTLHDAIGDEAVIKTEFHLSDGRASWIYAGEPFEAQSLDEDPRALFSALHTGFADQLLRDTVKHWQAWRATHRRSKLLVVCANEPQSKRIKKLMAGLSVDAEVATYREDDADERIERFKGDGVEALITVNKAYEGLDVPQITHIACLTHIRSIPWLNQMLARGWRCDWKGDAYRDQVAFVFAPADKLFQEAIQAIWDAFQHRVMDLQDTANVPTSASDGRDGDSVERDVVTPRDSDKTFTIGKILGDQSWGHDEMSDLLHIQEEVMARGMPPMPLDQLAAVVEIIKTGAREPVGASPKANGAVYWTPGQRVDDLKRDLNGNVYAAARLMAQESGVAVSDHVREINGQVVKKWRKRNLMEESELQAAIAWVRQFYGLE